MSVPTVPDADTTADLLSFAKDLAQSAGALIREAFAKERGDYDCKSATDPVTETDHAVEAHIFGRIRERFPKHSLIGEESASDTEWTNAPTWIIDPIDGTANFVHRIPMCAVSIGFTVARQLVVGVVYNPILDELFSASHMTQTQLNGRPVSVSKVSRLNEACFATECGSDRSQAKVSSVLTNLRAVLENNAQCIRMMGSCALNMANIACGRADVFYERGPYAWDMAAGALLIRQAGGVVLGGGLGVGGDFDLTGRCVLAFTPTLGAELGVRFGGSVPHEDGKMHMSAV